MTEKATLRAAMAEEIGVRMDDELERADSLIHKADGRAEGSRAVAVAIEKLMPRVDAEIEAETLSLESAGAVKRWLAVAQSIALSLGKQGDNQKLKAEGAQAALTGAVKIVKKVHEVERGKMPTAVLVPDERPVEARTQGVKARRQAAAKPAKKKPAKKAAKKKAARKSG